MDRFFANKVWMDLFQFMEALNLEFYHSGHCLVNLELSMSSSLPPKLNTNRFKFETKWLVEEDFTNEIARAWNSLQADDLHTRLHESGSYLLKWAKERVGNT